ncbi:MAG: LysR family transcriptional regulator [Motiliproteus sp.]|nr:LysR family transcriptional regulator [Motiliproteus sp.]
MDLYHLKTFAAVAEEGHLTRAADRLYTSQPAISAHIKALEEELGVSLFKRTPKGMQLTAEGEQLLPKALLALQAAGEFVEHAKGLRDELVGGLSIGLNSDAEFLRLPKLLEQMQQKHPKLELQFMGGQTSTNIPATRVGKLDAAFISGEFSDPRLEVLFLQDISLKVAAPIGMRDQISDPKVELIADLPWIYTSPDCAYFGVMRDLFDQHCCQPAKTVVSDSEEALRTMIKAGIGLGIMRGDELRQAEKEGFAFEVPIELPKVSLQFIYQKQRQNDPVLKALLNEIAELWGLAEDQEDSQQVV